MDDVRAYESPPRPPDSWRADRPGDLEAGQPAGHRLGNQGPDQGYALKLAHDVFGPELRLGAVRLEDAVAGCVTVALKRASLFGRAPVVHDLRLAFTLFGFLDDAPPADLVAAREEAFAEVAHPHHYGEARAIADAVPASTLRRRHDDVRAADWRELIDPARLTHEGAPEGAHG
jgi:hypothetical protein